MEAHTDEFVVCEQCKHRMEPENVAELDTGGFVCKKHWFDAEIQEQARRHHIEHMELTARIAAFDPLA